MQRIKERAGSIFSSSNRRSYLYSLLYGGPPVEEEEKTTDPSIPTGRSLLSHGNRCWAPARNRGFIRGLGSSYDGILRR